MIRHASMVEAEPVAPAVPRPAVDDFVVVMPVFSGGGARRDVVLLCNALAAKGVSVTILVLVDEGPLRELIDPQVRVVDLGVRRIRYALSAIRRAIRAAAPQMVLCSESSLNLACLAAVRTLPRKVRPLIVLREVASPSAAQQFDPSWQGRVAYRVLRHFYRYADCVITLTNGARRDLIENFLLPQEKVATMLSNAVITPDVTERIDGWDGESGRESGLVVSVGRLSPEKNQRLLLEAMTQDVDGSWRLALVGDGPERAPLERYASRHGLAQRVMFVGFDPDPFAWLMKAQVAVCSSVYEGLCNAIIEALGCGTPVVSTDCPFGPREILQGGQFGRLVPEGDAPALAQAIRSALGQPVDRQRLIHRSLDYTAERAADNLLEIVTELV